jgi:type I restriction enzyme, S subunit
VKERYLLQCNDILITLTGTRKKRDYGFVAIVKDEKNLLLNQRVARLRFHTLLNPSYFLIALQSEQFRDGFFKNETGNVGQGNVSMQAITTELIPLPPLAEQEQIVAEFEQCLSVISQLEATVEANLKRSERLRQSILHEAFAGRLVPQDPTDEPASVLLERIQNERSGQKNGTGVHDKKSRAVKVPEPVTLDAADAEQTELWESVGN